jgi:hypothetical protein
MTDSERAQIRMQALDLLLTADPDGPVLAKLPDADAMALWLMAGTLPASDPG